MECCSCTPFFFQSRLSCLLIQAGPVEGSGVTVSGTHASAQTLDRYPHVTQLGHASSASAVSPRSQRSPAPHTHPNCQLSASRPDDINASCHCEPKTVSLCTVRSAFSTLKTSISAQCSQPLRQALVEDSRHLFRCAFWCCAALLGSMMGCVATCADVWRP